LKRSEFQSFGFDLDRFDPSTQALRSIRGWGRPRFQAPAHIAQRAHDFGVPIPDGVSRPVHLATRQRSVANRTHPRREEQEIDVAIIPILQGETGVGYTWSGIKLAGEVP
jgi:hypothetical protein